MTLDFTPTENQAKKLADHWPKGRIWVNKYKETSGLGKIAVALANEFTRSEVFTQKILTELNLNKTIDLIERWEESVGIPDDCFTTDVDIETRRLQVLQKLISFGGAQTEQDFIDIANIFGFTITVSRPGTTAVFPLQFPIQFFGGGSGSSRNTIFIQLPLTEYIFPLPFPLKFSASSGIVLECIFRALVPITTDVIFQFGS